MKKLVTSTVVTLVAVAVATAAEIRNVTAKQRFPWNGKVDITYEVVGDVTEEFPSWNQPVLSVMATNRTDGSHHVAVANTFSGDTGTAVGTHHVVWDMSAQGLDFKSDDVVFTAAYRTPFDVPGMYCVIDLSGGANASTYPVSYLADVPTGGWTDEYKTTKLVSRLIEPGSIPTRDAAITRPFYCGVFEVTQKQYELVTGSRPSHFNNASYYATRPVETVSYNMIRGASSGSGWPGSSAVDVDSFLGKIRARTGLDLDLPTEAQWEYACRAETATDYNNGKNNTGSTCANMNEVGRYWYNGGQNYSRDCGTSAGTAKVGSYQPNAWGLYDMHGNVAEWCLDWYGGSLSGNDPVGSSSGSYRVRRGGGWCSNADNCTSSFRNNYGPSYESSNRHGFRLVRTLSN